MLERVAWDKESRGAKIWQCSDSDNMFFFMFVLFVKDVNVKRWRTCAHLLIFVHIFLTSIALWIISLELRSFGHLHCIKKGGWVDRKRWIKPNVTVKGSHTKHPVCWKKSPNWILWWGPHLVKDDIMWWRELKVIVADCHLSKVTFFCHLIFLLMKTMRCSWKVSELTCARALAPVLNSCYNVYKPPDVTVLTVFHVSRPHISTRAKHWSLFRFCSHITPYFW